jgi:hypothetical protein
LWESARVALDETSDLIELVLRTYGSLSADHLDALVKTELPWREAREGLPEDAPSANPISEASMARFFRSHRRLDGRKAAELAVVGIHVWARDHPGRVDVASIIESLGDVFLDPGDNPWGSSNLDDGLRHNGEGIVEERRPADTGA